MTLFYLSIYGHLLYKYCLLYVQFMDIIRPSLDKDLIHKILDIKPKYITTPAFLNMLLEEAYNARCEKKKNMTPYIHTMIKTFDECEERRELERKERRSN